MVFLKVERAASSQSILNSTSVRPIFSYLRSFILFSSAVMFCCASSSLLVRFVISSSSSRIFLFLSISTVKSMFTWDSLYSGVSWYCIFMLWFPVVSVLSVIIPVVVFWLMSPVMLIVASFIGVLYTVSSTVMFICTFPSVLLMMSYVIVVFLCLVMFSVNSVELGFT